MPREKAKLALLTRPQRAFLGVLIALGVLILANSLYLFAYTMWQEAFDSRARLLAFYQWMLVGHFIVGTVFVVLSVVFALLHLKNALRRRRSITIWTGILAVAASITVLVSGIQLLRLANTEANRWIFHAHRVAGVVGLVAYLVHRYRSYDPTPIKVRLRTTIEVAVLTVAMVGVHAIGLSGSEPPPVVYETAFRELDVSEDPFIPFEPLGDVPHDAPFFPSPASLAGGELLDPDVLMPGPPADAAKVREEHAAKGFASSQAIGAEDCRLCHQDSVAQWECSAHRFSSFNNPFYAASVIALREEAGPELSRFCGGCHDPAVMLAGDFLGEIDPASVEAQAGLTCTACHLINRVHDVTGNGNYELADVGEDPYLFADAVSGWQLEVRKYLIKARPRDHKDFFLRPFYRVPEYCAACHKVSVDSEINAYKWLRGQNEYDNWHNSGVSTNASRTFYLPEEPTKCQDCHMPYEAAPLGDLAAKGGFIRSHRFLAVNTALPHIRGDQETIERIERFLDGKLRVDLMAMEHPREGLVLDLVNNPPELRPGDEVVLYVVVRNAGVGHTFPGGTNDSNEGWIRLQARDAEGNTVLSSGELDEGGHLEDDAHRYLSVMLRKDSRPSMERDAHHFHVAGLVRVIPPGNADIVRFRLTVPDSSALEIDGALLWRKFNRQYTHFTSDLLELETPDLPITEIAADSLRLPIGEPSQTGGSGAAGWVRHNDLGIGLLRQGDFRNALAAFRAVAELVPDRVDGFRNQARVHLRQGDPDPVRPLLEACEERAPGDAQTKLWWGEVLLLEGDAAAAADMYEGVLESFPNDRETWRSLASARFRLREYEASLAATLQVLRIDPEDAAAHYQRMLVYRVLGDDHREAEALKAFERYRIDDNAPQIIKDWRLDDPVANREVEPLHVH